VTSSASPPLLRGLSAGIGLNCLFLNNRLVQYETGAGLGFALHNSSKGFVDKFVGINLKDTVKPFTGTGIAVGPHVYYSNAVTLTPACSATRWTS